MLNKLLAFVCLFCGICGQAWSTSMPEKFLDDYERYEQKNILSDYIYKVSKNGKKMGIWPALARETPWQREADRKYYQSFNKHLAQITLKQTSANSVTVIHGQDKLSILFQDMEQGKVIIGSRKMLIRPSSYSSAQEFLEALHKEYSTNVALKLPFIEDAQASYMVPYVLIAGGLLVSTVVIVAEKIATERHKVCIELQKQVDDICGKKDADKLGEREDLYKTIGADGQPKYANRQECLEKNNLINNAQRTIHKSIIGFEVDSPENYPAATSK